MNSERRIFVTAGAAALAFTPVTAAWGAENKTEPAKVDGMTCLDYGRSFICNTASFNAVRFWVEILSTIDGGYYFCPPGLKSATDFFGSGMFPESVSKA